MIAHTRRFWNWIVARARGAERKYRILIKYAAMLGAFLAIVCHFVPSNYKQICDALATLCHGG